MSMDPLHQRCITCRRRFLVREVLQPDELLDYLIEKEVITLTMEEDIMAKETRKKKVRELLTILPHCGRKAFGHLLKGLEETHQAHISAELKTKLANLERGIESDEEPEPDQPPPSEWNNYGPFNIATLKDGSNCIVS